MTEGALAVSGLELGEAVEQENWQVKEALAGVIAGAKAAAAAEGIRGCLG